MYLIIRQDHIVKIIILVPVILKTHGTPLLLGTKMTLIKLKNAQVLA